MSRVNVYNRDGEVIARVKYNSLLDRWNGSNWQSGGTGLHRGITRLKDGRYVLIYGTQWQGDRDRAWVISPEEALQEILKADREDLLEEKRFADLKALYEEALTEEDE